MRWPTLTLIAALSAACGVSSGELTIHPPAPPPVEGEAVPTPVGFAPAVARQTGNISPTRVLQASVWTGAGGWIEFPANYPASSYGAMFKNNQFTWITFKLHHGEVETTADRAAVAAWIKSWRPYVKYVGAWGWNVGSVDQAGVESEARWTANLIKAFNADPDPEKRIDFYIANAEASFEYSKCGNCYSASSWWATKFKAEMGPSFPRALSSMGRTDLHDIDWKSWAAHGFHWLPQAYWNAPESGGGTCDLPSRARYQPSLCVEVADVCPGSAEATTRGLNCVGSPTDCPCLDRGIIHATIGWGWGCADASMGAPTMDAYVGDLVSAKTASGAVGFSVYRVDNGGTPFNFPALFQKLSVAMATHGIATLPTEQ